jgi:hypothetical protein
MVGRRGLLGRRGGDWSAQGDAQKGNEAEQSQAGHCECDSLHGALKKENSSCPGPKTSCRVPELAGARFALRAKVA